MSTLVRRDTVDGTPLSYLRTNGPAATLEARLGLWLLVVSAAVVLLVTALVLWAGARGRGRTGGIGAFVEDESREGRWILFGGVLIPGVILVMTFAFTLGTLSATAAPRPAPAVSVRIIGHRWWWEIRYVLGDSATIVTANELHLPVGEPVGLQITSADVIHSFWVPKLAGKTDAIPGQTNDGWIEADSAGVYRGQCTEYCGPEHANMGIVAIAEPAAEFNTWLGAQRAEADVASDSVARGGGAVFLARGCGACHTLRGLDARGVTGPDLTHLASRETIASGTLANTRGNLGGWISNAPALKPGVVMPRMTLTPRELRVLLDFLTRLH